MSAAQIHDSARPEFVVCMERILISAAEFSNTGSRLVRLARGRLNPSQLYSNGYVAVGPRCPAPTCVESGSVVGWSFRAQGDAATEASASNSRERNERDQGLAASGPLEIWYGLRARHSK